MKRLVLKAALLLAPFAVLSAPVVARTLITVVRAERSVSLRDGVFNSTLEGKFRALVTGDTSVIVAGDSRAERQIIPAMVEARVPGRAANIACNGCDLITVLNLFRRHGAPNTLKMLIVSTSIFQVNDGAIDSGQISSAALLNMTAWERLSIYADRLGSPSAPLEFTFDEDPPAELTAALRREQGFLGVEGVLPLPLPEDLIEKHIWYRKVSLRGARWRVFQDALRGLAAMGFRIYLVQPPASPAWRATTAGTFVDRAEREFGQMLRSESEKYDNVRLLDFYAEPDPQLGNERFYDVQHLNRSGAAIFTRDVIDRIDASTSR